MSKLENQTFPSSILYHKSMLSIWIVFAKWLPLPVSNFSQKYVLSLSTGLFVRLSTLWIFQRTDRIQKNEGIIRVVLIVIPICTRQENADYLFPFDLIAPPSFYSTTPPSAYKISNLYSKSLYMDQPRLKIFLLRIESTVSHYSPLLIFWRDYNPHRVCRKYFF